MSQENVEVVRRMLQAFADGGLDATAEFWDPDIDWRAIEGAPDDVGLMQGLDAVQAYAQDLFDHFDDVRFEPEELIDAGDRVVAVLRLSGRGKGSGIETELRYAVVYTVSGGKIVRGREYMTREQALEAVGLRE
jgi:ketosteroid isomerase-like protein